MLNMKTMLLGILPRIIYTFIRYKNPTMTDIYKYHNNDDVDVLNPRVGRGGGGGGGVLGIYIGGGVPWYTKKRGRLGAVIFYFTSQHDQLVGVCSGRLKKGGGGLRGGGGVEGGGIYVLSTDRDVPLIWVCFFSDLVRVWVGNSWSRYLHDPYLFIKWYFLVHVQITLLVYTRPTGNFNSSIRPTDNFNSSIVLSVA